MRQPANQVSGLLRASASGISSSMRAAMRWVSERRSPEITSPATGTPSACSAPSGGKILGAGHVERPEHDIAAKPETAGEAALALAIGGVEIGAAGDLLAVAQGRIGIGRQHLDEHRRGRRRQIVRHQLLEQVRREFGEFVLQLELDPGGEECGAFEQARNHRIGAFADQPAEPLGDAGILIRELPGLLVQQLTIRDCRGREIPGPSG